MIINTHHDLHTSCSTIIAFFQKKDNEVNFFSLSNILDQVSIQSYQEIIKESNRKIHEFNYKDKNLCLISIKEIQDSEDCADNTHIAIKSLFITKISILPPEDNPEWLKNFLIHLMLKNYRFRKYLSPTHPHLQNDYLIENLEIISKTEIDLTNVQNLISNVYWSRDLCNEPANVCTPKWYAEQVMAQFEGLNVKVEILEEEELEKLGMNLLLGVGKGSVNKPRVVVLQYLNAGESDLHMLVGKGVCFDTGGISIKPSCNMGDMKDDMAGSSVVVASIRALAQNNIKTNVVGLIGLVENMPDGNALKPGDIVKAHSGLNVEVTNTDAEGRLVLADLLSYGQERFSPKQIVDIATLTGAIVIALGNDYAGLFSNDDTLSQELIQAGKSVHEHLWRMPLCEAYDRLIDSVFADIDNAGPREASSCTAAHFIKRFIKNTPWAHLDIAGTAFRKKPSKKSPVYGATGFGVQLIYQWLCDKK